MREIKPESEEALKAGRLRLFIFFDFMFFPLRVHSGEGHIEWEGQAWEGIGEILRENFAYGTTSLSSSPLWKNEDSGYSQGHLSASLPLDKITREVVHKGYYRGRKMELFLCSYDEQGNTIEGIEYVSNTIVEFGVKGNVITFRSVDDTLDSIAERDEKTQKELGSNPAAVQMGLVGYCQLVSLAYYSLPCCYKGLAWSNNSILDCL